MPITKTSSNPFPFKYDLKALEQPTQPKAAVSKQPVQTKTAVVEQAENKDLNKPADSVANKPKLPKKAIVAALTFAGAVGAGLVILKKRPKDAADSVLNLAQKQFDKTGEQVKGMYDEFAQKVAKLKETLCESAKDGFQDVVDESGAVVRQFKKNELNMPTEMTETVDGIIRKTGIVSNSLDDFEVNSIQELTQDGRVLSSYFNNGTGSVALQRHDELGDFNAIYFQDALNSFTLRQTKGNNTVTQVFQATPDGSGQLMIFEGASDSITSVKNFFVDKLKLIQKLV